MITVKKYLSREEWLADRVGKITGSKATAILGYSGWASAWKVYREEVEGHQQEHDEGTLAVFERGHLLEPLAAAVWHRRRAEELEGCDVLLGHEQEIGVTNPAHPRWMASPDVLILRDGQIIGGGEIKSVSRSDLGYLWDDDEPEPAWARELDGCDVQPGDDGDHVPVGWLVQILTYLQITGADWWDLIVIGPHIDQVSILRIHADRRKQRGIIRHVEEWWCEHIDARIPPNVDESDDCYASIRAAWPSRSGAVDLGADADEWATAYLEARSGVQSSERQRKRARAELATLLGSSARGITPNHTITLSGRGAISVKRR